MSACATSADPAPAQEIAELYRRLSKQLEQIVRLDVLHAPAPLVEDACQFAWGRLIHNRDRVQIETALGWLARTAVHEAFRLLRRERRCGSLEALGDSTPACWTSAPEEVIERRERLALLRGLPERQQRVLWLHALGLSYAEIALQTGDSVRTVERQLLRARQGLRDVGA
jgi:RNA polymerase sigma-70 factor (ECF subfamily)